MIWNKMIQRNPDVLHCMEHNYNHVIAPFPDVCVALFGTVDVNYAFRPHCNVSFILSRVVKIEWQLPRL
jgi:hypothetical protein